MPSLWDPTPLPCGQTVPNRLVKVAMYEHMALFLGGPPNENHFNLYAQWARNEWGMIVTGNVQIDGSHLSLGRDVVIPRVATEESLAPFRKLASVIHGPTIQSDATHAHHQRPSRPLAVMQLNHSGRQSTNILGGRLPFKSPLAPSAVRVGSGRDTSFGSSIVHALMFQKPKAMSIPEVEEMVDAFVRAAKFASLAKFDGVQLHVAHGYLLAQFLSPKTNIRTDKYAAEHALDLLRHIIASIRAVVPKDFVLGIKLNAADYIDSKTNPDMLTQQETRALEDVLKIAQWGSVDFIEISGGDYEKPDFMSTHSNKSQRQAFFSRFSRHALGALEKLYPSSSSQSPDTPPSPRPLILLTGGLRTPKLICSALNNRHGDLFGMGRASVVCPQIPRVLREDAYRADEPFAPEPKLPRPKLLDTFPFSYLPRIQLIGAGVTMAWYTLVMRQMAYFEALQSSKEGSRKIRLFRPDYKATALQAVVWMWLWVPSARVRKGVQTLVLYVLPFVGVLAVAILFSRQQDYTMLTFSN